jgi:hypothetical protein
MLEFLLDTFTLNKGILGRVVGKDEQGTPILGTSTQAQRVHHVTGAYSDKPAIGGG